MNAKTIRVLREALAKKPRVLVQIALNSGPCWVTAVGISSHARTPIIQIEIAGARLEVAGSTLLEIET
jgi:hypothetical protein